jgi:hypothetical protein
MALEPLHCMTLGSKLVDAGLLRDGTVRAIIDIKLDDVVTVYVECLGDRRLLEDIDLGGMLRGAQVVRTWQVPTCRRGRLSRLWSWLTGRRERDPFKAEGG